jgi:hypothetical protein
MKCIRYKSNLVIERVKDDVAARAVASDAAHYVPKSTWKAYLGDERALLIAAAREVVKLTLPERQAASTKREAAKAERRAKLRKKREDGRRALYKKAA